MDKIIKEGRSLLKHFEDRKARARERLTRDGSSWMCFALLGFAMDSEMVSLGKDALFRRVEEPPGEVELACALKNRAIFSSVARYSHSISYELAISSDLEHEANELFTYAWWIVSALRVRTSSDFLVPVAASCSWSVIAAAPDQTVDVHFVEDVPKAHRFNDNIKITNDDIAWVADNISIFSKLLEFNQFRLAIDALTTHSHQASLRMVLASIWAGVEALFEIQSELKFRLATYIASFLEPRGMSRYELFSSVKRQYDFRSKAVHGSQISDEELYKNIRSMRIMLSRIICRIMEHGEVPTVKYLDSIVFED